MQAPACLKMWSLYPLIFSVFFPTVKFKWQFLSFFFVKQAHQFIIVNLVNPIKFWKNRPWTFTNIQRNISAGTLVYCPGIHMLEPHVFVSLQRISKKLKLGSLTKIQHDSSIHETIFVFPWNVLKKMVFLEETSTSRPMSVASKKHWVSCLTNYMTTARFLCGIFISLDFTWYILLYIATS